MTEAEKKTNILVVDDVAENRLLIQVILKKFGYDTTLCCNGQEAIDRANEKKYDLILMDVQMEGINGLDATKQIKSMGKNTETAIIAMTAYSANSDKMLCIEAGCDDYISKPINKEGLIRKINRFLKEKEQIANASQGGDIKSLFHDNSDYRNTIEMFVENLPNRIEEMQKAFDEGNLKELALKAHALKGLGGFAGFPIYTEKAKFLEKMIENNQVENIREQLDEIIKLCIRTKLTPNK